MICKTIVPLAALAGCLLSSGCATPPAETILLKYEHQLDIDGAEARDFHSALYYPKGLALHYPGYIVGMQKSPQIAVNGPSHSHSHPPPGPFVGGPSAGHGKGK